MECPNSQTTNNPKVFSVGCKEWTPVNQSCSSYDGIRYGFRAISPGMLPRLLFPYNRTKCRKPLSCFLLSSCFSALLLKSSQLSDPCLENLQQDPRYGEMV